MVYELENRKLEIVGELRTTKVNDVLVCRNLMEEGKREYLLWKLKDHTIARKIIQELYGSGKKESCLDCFTQGSNAFFLFPYEQSRPLLRFWRTAEFKQKQQSNTEKETEQNKKMEICKKLVLECKASYLPFSLLYLVLRQEQVHVSPQGELFFQMDLDLTQWSDQAEDSCVQACAKLIQTFFDRDGKKWERNLYRLLEKKTERRAYQNFRELYGDISLLRTVFTKKRWGQNGISEQGKSRLFKILLWSSMILIILAIVIFISYLIFGEVPLFRLFEHGFEQIGTESLLQ